MAPSSFQRYINGASTVFQRYFDASIAKNYRRTSGERATNDWSHPYPTVGELRGETCQTLVFSKSDDRFWVAKPYMVMRRKGCGTTRTTEKEKT